MINRVNPLAFVLQVSRLIIFAMSHADDDLDEFDHSEDSSNEDINEDVKQEFDSACQFLASNAGRFSESDLLYFYAHYKQATVGECKTEKPGLFDFAGKKKWSAWKALGTLTKCDAMKSYVARLRSLDSSWKADTSVGASDRTAFNRHSQPVHEDEPENDDDPFQLVSNANLDKLRLLLKRLSDSEAAFDITTLRNEDGLTLLHLACDRGYLELAQYLINDCRIDVNALDESGQTALHYGTFSL